MNTDELKKLLKNSTTVLILENGEPSLVILGYDTYKDLILISGRSGAEVEVPLRRDANGTSAQDKSSKAFQNRIIEKESELLDKINKQILSLKDEIENEEKSADVSLVD